MIQSITREYVRSINARTRDGATVTIEMYQEYNESQLLDGNKRKVPTIASFFTSDGRPVDYVAPGIYRINLEDIDLATDEP